MVAVPAAVLALTAVIGLLGRMLVDRPLASIRETVLRAGARDLSARALVLRDDELGRLARGLNGMLDQLEDFNATLREEVRRATEELREQNRLLLENAQRLFAARRELARAQQLAAAGRMAAAVAHQIGTPLNLISGYVQMLLEAAPLDSADAARLRTVREQIARVTAIVQGLLDQSRLPPLKKRALAPGAVVASVCDLARPTLERAGVALVLRVEEDLPLVLGDAGQLEQAFLNMVANALDAMPSGGTLTLEARRGGEQVEFRVSDSGVGISPEDLPRVFDPLFTTKAPGEGTGLGLAIVRDVLHAHGGRVAVACPEGGGTVFTVTLPAASVAAHA
jgi:signal transduction histidine kinase